MAVNLIGALIHKFDTAANWTSNDPTLLENEFGWESDTGKVKRGDGSTSWTGLSYFDIYAGGSADGIGLPWQFSTTIGASPASGYIQFDASSFGTLTNVYINSTGSVTSYGAELFDSLNDLGSIYIQARGDSSKYLYFDFDNKSESSGVYTFPINSIHASGSFFENNDYLDIIPIPDLNDASYLKVGALSGMSNQSVDSAVRFLAYDGGVGYPNYSLTPSNLFEGCLTEAKHGLPFAFDSNTASGEPGTNAFRLNNASPASATAVYIKKTTVNSEDVSDLLEDLESGDYFILEPTLGVDSFIAKVSGAITDNTTWVSIPVTVISAPAATYNSSSYYQLTIMYKASSASGGDGLGLTWNFDTTTSATPASGDIRFDNATPASVTEVYINETGAVSVYGRDMLQGLKNGDALFIQVVGDTSKYLYFNITSLTDNGADWTVEVDTVLGSGSLPANNDVVSVVPVYLSTGGLSDLVDDTTPQLGGNLDAQTNNITNIGNIEVEGHSYADAEVDDGNSSTADTIDWTTGNFHKSTMTGNCTYTFTAPSGATTLILKLVQGGSGSYTATFPATVKWAGGTAPTLSTAVGAVDIVTFYWDGTNYFGTAVLNLS